MRPFQQLAMHDRAYWPKNTRTFPAKRSKLLKRTARIHVASVMFENYSNATLFSPEYSEQYVCTGTSLVLCDVTVFWLECHQHFDPVMILKSDVLTLFLHEITFQKPGPRPISRFEHCRAEFSGYWSRRPYPGLRKNAMVVIL